MCHCVNPIPIACKMERNGISRSLAECLGECRCECHFDVMGAVLPNHHAWSVRKQQLETMESIRLQRLENRTIIHRNKLAMQARRRVRSEQAKRSCITLV